MLPSFRRPGFWGSLRLTEHLHIATRGVLDGLELVAVRLDPLDPVRPPRARMLLRLLEPGFERARARFAAGPILVLGLARRIDDAGDVAGAGQHVFYRSAEEFRAEERRLGRRD